MNIVIESNFEKEDIKNINNLIWKKYQKNYIKFLFLLLILSLIFIYSGLNTDYTFASVYDIKGNSNIKNIYQYDFNFQIGFGLSILLIMLFYIINFFKAKKNFYNQSQSIINCVDNKSIRLITDEFYEYHTSNFQRKYNWKSYETYEILENFLIFNTIKKSNTCSDFLNLKSLNEEGKNLLFNHLMKINIKNESLKK